MEMIFGIVAFVVLFAAWVVVPTIVKKRHAVKAEDEAAD
jgi:xanthine/uracil permease